MNRGWVVLLMALAIPIAAFAQEAGTGEGSGEPEMSVTETAAVDQAATGDYARYEAADFGFSIELPSSGVVLDPSSADWNQEESVAFIWEAGGGEPIQLILGRADSFDAPVDEMTFTIVCGTMLESWQDEPANYTIITANEKLTTTAGPGKPERVWNLIEIADTSHAEGKAVHYSMFTTYAGNSVYSVTMYYMEPVSATIREFGIPVIYSFALAD